MKKKKSFNVGIVFPGRFPWNRGIGQLYDILETMGHKPVVLSRAAEERYAGKGYNGLRTVRMRKNGSLLNRVKSYPVAVNYFWKQFILKNALRKSFDCIIVRETHVLPQCVLVARQLDIPCFVDMRENLAFMYKTTKAGRDLNLFHDERYVFFVERKYLRKTKHIFTVSEELRSWLVEQYGLSEHQISVLGNYPDSKFLSRIQGVSEKKERDKDSTIKLVFAGAVNETKGIQDIIVSLPSVLAKHKCRFTIIGEGPYLSNLQDLVYQLSLQMNVIFKPLLPPKELPSELAKHDIGVCPYFLNEFTHQTMPGKLFEYMAVGLPVFSSARKPVVRILENERNGVIHNSRDTKEISTKLVYMIENVEERLIMGRNSREAVLKKYNYMTSLKRLEHIFALEHNSGSHT